MPGDPCFRGVTEHISATLRIGWDSSEGFLFPVVDPNETRGTVAVSARRMTAGLQMNLRAAGLPDHYSMHSFRMEGSLSKSLEGTAVDEIMKIGGWKTEQVARYVVGSTTSAPRGAAGQKRDRVSNRQRESYATAIDLPLSPACQEDFAACTKRLTGEIEQVWVNQPTQAQL